MQNPNDQDLLRRNALFNWEEPGFAFDSALQERGYNPYAANPFIQSIRQLAPGLSSAYLVNRATNPANPNLGTGSDYQSWLRDVLGGPQGQAGGSQLYATINQGRQGLQGAIQSARQQPANAANLNPFMAALQSRLGMNTSTPMTAANAGEGATDMLMAMNMPFLSRGMAGAYGRALEQAREQAYRRFWQRADPTQGDIYTELFGF